MSFKKNPERKETVEKLQENHLQGPADLPLQQIAEDLKVDQVVVAPNVPHMEKIIFRNQRDPGYPLEFHYSSKTHPFKAYTLIDGQEYTLAWEVIRNLEGCRENIEKYRRNAEGIPQIYIAGYKTHFVCERAA